MIVLQDAEDTLPGSLPPLQTTVYKQRDSCFAEQALLWLPHMQFWSFEDNLHVKLCMATAYGNCVWQLAFSQAHVSCQCCCLRQRRRLDCMLQIQMRGELKQRKHL